MKMSLTDTMVPSLEFSTTYLIFRIRIFPHANPTYFIFNVKFPDPAASSSSLKSRSHDSLRSSSCHPKLTAMDHHTDPDKSGSSERRMARYKEERRRQLASHVKDRLSGGVPGGGHHLESRRSRKRSSSSSSDDNEVQEVGT